MGEDETGTRARFNAQFETIIKPAIDEHSGRLVKTMGDGFLVEFGSVVEAVQCATEIQSGTGPREADKPDDRKLVFRIGVHLGDVIAEDDDIHGDGVNLAARLEGLADPGGICVSDLVYAAVRKKLSIAFDDIGEQSFKNIADPVQVFRVVLDKIYDGSASKAEAIFRRPAVAVLPFQNMSDDSEQEYFADGLTEDIITALSLWKTFPVIARNSTFAYKGKSPDIREVGTELGARYIVEGSVRKAGNRVRVTAQLINAETGHHVWAERYDREISDVFALQDEITQRIATTVQPALEQLEQKHIVTRLQKNLAAWDYCMRGYAHIYERTKEATETARQMFLRAIELDPQFARAYIGLAYSYYQDLRFHGAADRKEWSARWTEAARRAIALDNTDADAHTMLGRVYQMVSGQPDAAIAEAREAVALNPHNAQANSFLGAVLALGAARYDEGIHWMERALALNPLDPRRLHIHLNMLSFAHLGAGRYETALTYAQEASRRSPDSNIEARVALASTLGHLGQAIEAQKAVQAVADKARDHLERHILFAPALKDLILDGLRKAGLPE